MKFVGRLLAALVGFALGAAVAIFGVGLYVKATYVCPPGVSEPCDVGGFVGLGLVMVWAPVLGLVCAALGYWLARRRQRRRAG
ncbi:hypothetical protein [Lysobacter solisilvae (ex Woo and Kim 2020)]|uniref:Uncharacterized protein n=1 Tax=Agrilutibacter terrestris TaxID=2865112 RepID=A0A7H0G0L3_9GAMM|nr:hypothetical protein [Lysobacter terrestris]QNP41829.1 hypothetical protein H8B22_06400 [Lysobacter terrestris]